MGDASYDLIVIGAGPGGYVAAIRAAQLGMRVACIEKDASLGGTCLNVGCIPSKALLDSSHRLHDVQENLAAHGVRVSGVELDLATMMKRKDKVVQILTRGVAGLFKKNKVTRLEGTARILDARTVEVGGKERASAERILIATGSAPVALPNLPFDGKRIVSSTEALALPAVPKRLLVVGAGAVGLELGSVWRRLGAEVVVVEMLDRIVPGMDPEMAKGLQRALEHQGMQFKLGTKVASAAENGGGLRVTLEPAATLDCDVALVAVGRRPYTDGLGLEALGVQVERGRVVVNQRFETSVAGIFAIGDVVAGPMLAHKAEEEGIAAVEGMQGLPVHVNYDAVANIVYTWPELASVGIGEDEAKKRGHAVRVGKFPFMANGRAKCMGETDGSIKVVADQRNDRVLGIHILGPNASDLIAEAALALEFGASSEDIGRTVHAHPTLAEALKEAALAVDGRAIHI